MREKDSSKNNYKERVFSYHVLDNQNSQVCYQNISSNKKNLTMMIFYPHLAKKG
jgi:hypothetical protein